MFRTSRSSQSHTDSYLNEMLRAMLEVIMNVPRVYITQSRIQYGRVEELFRNPSSRWREMERPFASNARTAVMEVYFITEDGEKRSASAEVDLTDESGVWSMLRAFIHVPGYMDGRRFDFHFNSDNVCRKANIPHADPGETTIKLTELSYLLSWLRKS